MSEINPYHTLGGEVAVRELVDRFYALMDQVPEAREIREMHQADLEEMRLKLFEFLSGWLGGPPLYIQRHGPVCIRSAHAPFPIGTSARDQWVLCMSRAMQEMDVDAELRALLEAAFERMAGAFVNRPA